MKKVLFFSICLFILASVNISVGQELTLKEKKSSQTTEANTSTETTSDTLVIPPLTLKKKEVKKTFVQETTQSTVSNTNTTLYNRSDDNAGKYNFPISQFELYAAFVRYSEYQMKGSGFNIQFTVRQKPDPLKKSTWGLGALFGKYETKVPQINSTTFVSKTKEFGGFVSYAKTTNRPHWNSFVMNVGVKQNTDEGINEDFKRKQIDILLFLSMYIDLTRSKDAFFSRTNFSMYYQYPAKTEIETYNNGERIDDFIWNHKMLSLNLDVTVLQFNITEAVDRASFNVGVNAGYKHFSQYIKDIYVGGVFVELFYKLIKVARIGTEFHIDPNNNPTKDDNNTFTGKKTEVKAEFDLFQIGRMIF